MAKPAANADVIRSINDELREHYQRLVDAYRPDLKEDRPPGKPIFHHLIPCHIAEQREIDRSEISVAGLLTTKHHEEACELPQHLLLLGRPESGKTALFALILHYWLHEKSMVDHLKDFDLLLAIQCLGLENFSSADRKTAEDLEKHILDHIPSSLEKHGKEVLQQAMKEAKVLIMIDSLDCLRGGITLNEDTSLALWSHCRVIMFCRYKFMKDNPSHITLPGQSKPLMLQLWGGLTITPFQSFPKSPEDISQLDGVFSEKLLKEYCYRLCKCKNKDYDQFWRYYSDVLKYFSTDMRKPFNIYMVMEEFCNNTKFDVTVQSDLYGKWFDIFSKFYRTTVKSDSNPTDLILKGTPILQNLAHKVFFSDKEYFFDEENLELVPFFTHFLMPHYNPHGKIQQFTFRIAAHKFFLTAKHIVNEIDLGTAETANILPVEEFSKLHPLLPMTLGIARGSNHYEKLKEHTTTMAKLILEDHITAQFYDQIINYAVTLLSETKLFSKLENNFDQFVHRLVGCLKENNWSIVDGNMHPEALKTLCECGHDIKEKAKRKPQRLNINLEGSPYEMPGLTDILIAVKNCNLRINLSCKGSMLNEDGRSPLDDAVDALQGRGNASLASISGYLKNIWKLDTDPATRRTYKIALRICCTDEYESLREICKNSHNLNRVMMRISYKADVDFKKLRELPASVDDLTLYLEGFNGEDAKKGMNFWRSIQGTAPRRRRMLRFWDIPKRALTPTAVKNIICADLSATRIEVPLEQPVSEYDEADLQKQLNNLKEDKYVIKLKGSHLHERRDMKKQGIE